VEVVSLDAMDGFEFQRFVAHLFECLGFGKIKEINEVQDSGRDIIIQSSNKGLIVIECKHHPEGSIGRPVVQKLHSAVMTANASKGYIVTTGRFSVAALNYIKKLNGLIELIDSRILYDMASRANIRLLKKGEKTAVYYVIPPAKELVTNEVLAHLVGNAISQPWTPSQLAKIDIKKIHFTPAYVIEYNLNEEFSTTVGVIHGVHIDHGRILINAQNGQQIDPNLEKMAMPWSFSESMYLEESVNVSSGTFKLGYTSAKKAGLRHIQSQNTQEVSYYGANNVCYTKKCVPHISKILIRSLTQAYLPYVTVSCQILTRWHEIFFCGNQKQVEILESKAGICELCGEHLGYERLLCNSCGKIVHRPSFMGHSYHCEVCGKTICKDCSYYTRKYLLFKKKLCQECAKNLEKENKVKKLGV
jgi:restriction system protein